jgi:hypothetical protein
VAIDAKAAWDVGGRLAKATNRALESTRWDPCAALACRDRGAFGALIESDERAGLARRILDRALTDPILMEDWQAAALFAVTRQKADRDALAGLIESVESWFAGALKSMRPW